jgi:hypothetical protein
MSNELFNKIKVAEYCSVFFSLYGIGLSILLYEMKNITIIDDFMDVVLSYNCLCTLGLMCSIYFRYNLQLRWLISRGLLTEYDNLINTGWWKDMVCEMLVNVIAPYPFLYDIKYKETVS